MSSNITKLIIRKMAHDAIPPDGGLPHALKFLTSPDLMKQSAANAKVFVRNAIDAIKAAPDNPYGDDDEKIAGAILAELVKKGTTTHHGPSATHPRTPANRHARKAK